MNHDLETSMALEQIRAAAAKDVPAEDGFIIGTIGQDVPVELIVAAGAVPLRLRGNPMRSTEEADRYLGRGLDPAVRSILAGLLDGAFGRLDAIVVSSDCDASQRLYYFLRELRRTQPEAPIPLLHLVDILHLNRESTARYNLRKLRQFARLLGRWTGIDPSGERLRRAVLESNERRALQRRVMALRTELPARLTGTDALAVFAAADRLTVGDYRAYLEALLRDADLLPGNEGIRAFVTGSSHDTEDVYRAVERAGVVIVGEDHDWGQLLCAKDIVLPEDSDEDGMLDAIARRYQLNGPTAPRASIQDRAAATAAGAKQSLAEMLLSYVRECDEAGLWDFARQRAEVGMPAGIVTHQPYGQLDGGALNRALKTPERTGVNG